MRLKMSNLSGKNVQSDLGMSLQAIPACRQAGEGCALFNSSRAGLNLPYGCG